MSDRVVWVTEPIYCKHCFEAVKIVLVHGQPDQHGDCAVVVKSVWDEQDFGAGVVAGFLKTLTGTPAEVKFEFDAWHLDQMICHPVVIAWALYGRTYSIGITPTKDV